MRYMARAMTQVAILTGEGCYPLSPPAWIGSSTWKRSPFRDLMPAVQLQTTTVTMDPFAATPNADWMVHI